MSMGMANGMPGAFPYGYGPQNFIYCDDPMKELAEFTGAIIR